jgi:hypothetical protein
MKQSVANEIIESIAYIFGYSLIILELIFSILTLIPVNPFSERNTTIAIILFIESISGFIVLNKDIIWDSLSIFDWLFNLILLLFAFPTLLMFKLGQKIGSILYIPFIENTPITSSINLCPSCNGKGAVNKWGHICIPSDIDFKANCHMCDGKGRIINV